MAVEQAGKLDIFLESLLTDLNALSNPQDFLAFRKSIGLVNGTGANQANRRWSSPGRSLGGSASESLDLAGVLLDYRGNAITFARIKIIAIHNNGPNVIQIGSGSNAFVNWVPDNTGHRIQLRSGGGVILYAPDATAYAVTGGTADQLQITNTTSGTITYDIALIGSSA